MAKNSKVGHFRGNDSYKGSPYNFIQMKTFDELDLRIISASKSFSGRIGMTLSICIYKKIYICIVVAQDFQVSNSGSWEPLVLEPPWNPPLKNLCHANPFWHLH
jgi:hypothetical protein